ncbi:cysteine desulfurase family protein [Nostocoides vanveenii]|uniref:cysteine desulfurase n=1 Tax=Nostocoides vanveenii TaxID=330835 RepID=A0ABN2K3U2_9MICO
MTVYLDHAATTPMLPAARAAMIEQLEHTGNASAIHSLGREARRVVEESRERIAAAVGALPSEVIFTSGGTEADNLAVKGTYAARHAALPARRRLVVGGIEHHAVLDPVEYLLGQEGAEVTFVEPAPDGLITPDALAEALGPDPGDVALISIMWANNEIGTIAPIPALAAIAREHGIPMHSDAVQAVGHIRVDFAASGLDLLTLTGHKLGGPVGIGALLARRDARLVPLLHGGGQERQVRSGTLDVPAIAALAVAIDESVAGLAQESQRQIALRDNLIERALALGLDLHLTGAWTPGNADDRLPGNVHLRVPGADGDSLLFLLDAADIACATGSACSAGVPRASHVVLALGIPDEEARGALRLSLGHTSTQSDVDAVIAALPAAVERARRARGAA